MKYAAILTYTTGSVAGATVEADSLPEAWQKLMVFIPVQYLRAVSMAEVPTSEHEIR